MAKPAPIQSEREEREPRIYEIGYLLSPVIRAEDIEAKSQTLHALVTSLGGVVIADGAPEYIDLAYTMIKVIDNKKTRFDQAYFGWIKFELNPEKTAELKELFDREISIIRYLFISTVRENTVLSKKPLSKILRREDRASTGVDVEGGLSAEAEVIPEATTAEEVPVAEAIAEASGETPIEETPVVAPEEKAPVE